MIYNDNTIKYILYLSMYYMMQNTNTMISGLWWYTSTIIRLQIRKECYYTINNAYLCKLKYYLSQEHLMTKQIQLVKYKMSFIFLTILLSLPIIFIFQLLR